MEVRFWENKSGRAPVLEFIEKQPTRAFKRIADSVDHFEERGLLLLASPGKMKLLTGFRNLYELKIDFKGIFYRIIFCIFKGVAYLLTAFKKKDNHTQRRHINTALNRQQMLAQS